MAASFPASLFRPREKAFSLSEMLVVMGIAALLLALAAPSLLSVAPSRKASIHELAGSLEYARAQAIARQQTIYVTFADAQHPGKDRPYRAYGLYVSADPVGGNIRTQPLRELDRWRLLPDGTVFARGADFEVDPGFTLRTVFDAAERREFPIKLGSGPVTSANLPFIAFGPTGQIAVPEFYNADTLHLGIAEGFTEPDRNTVFLTRSKQGIRGGTYPQGECLSINYYTGAVQILTD